MTRELPSFPAPRSRTLFARGWSGAGYSLVMRTSHQTVIGGGFGNKQDVLEEPMAAFLPANLAAFR